jgi:hypothetical protein
VELYVAANKITVMRVESSGQEAFATAFVFRKRAWRALRTLSECASDVIRLRSFVVFVVMNGAQQFMCAFNNNMWVVFLDVFFGTSLQPWQRSVLVFLAFILPHANTIVWTPVVQQHGTYWVFATGVATISVFWLLLSYSFSLYLSIYLSISRTLSLSLSLFSLSLSLYLSLPLSRALSHSAYGSVDWRPPVR